MCVLGLGSNLPYKGFSCVELITSAVSELRNHLSDLRCSPLYKTAPLHITDQDFFFNAAVCGYFTASPSAAAARNLLEIIQKIETQHGRDRLTERRWGERSLDIDILLFGELIIAENDLIIPHPRLKERAFALRPLLDVLPGAAEPGTGKQYSEILTALPYQEMRLVEFFPQS